MNEITTRVAHLHSIAAADYAKGQAQRAAAKNPGSYAEFAPAAEPSDLAVAVNIARQVLDSDEIVPVREALRLVLRALGAEAVGGR